MKEREFDWSRVLEGELDEDSERESVPVESSYDRAERAQPLPEAPLPVVPVMSTTKPAEAGTTAVDVPAPKPAFAGRLRRLLRTKQQLRDAVLLYEVLGPPKGMR